MVAQQGWWHRPRRPLTGERRLLASVGCSLALHGLVLAWQQGRPQPGVPAPRLYATLRLPPALVEPAPGGVAMSRARKPERLIETGSAPRRGRLADAPEPAAAGTEPATTVPPIAGDRSGGPDTLPRIDIDAARRLARQTARGPLRAGAPPAQATAGDDHKTVLGRAIARSAVADCRTAHAGWGLLAIPYLIRDAVKDGGCNW